MIILSCWRSPGEGNGNPLHYSCWKIPWTGSLAGYSPWGHKELGPTERITLSLSLCLAKLGSQFLPNKDYIHYICWIIKKAREFQKNIYLCFIDYAKAFDCVDLNKLWKILKEMGIPDHLTCLLRNLYGGQEAAVRTRHGTMNWFQIGKGVHQVCILPPCFLNSMQNTSCELPGWMKHKLKSRLPGEISIT